MKPITHEPNTLGLKHPTQAFDETTQAIEGYDPDGEMYIPAGIQRIVICTARQSVIINYVAWRNDAGQFSNAMYPEPSVDFFDKRI